MYRFTRPQPEIKKTMLSGSLPTFALTTTLNSYIDSATMGLGTSLNIILLNLFSKVLNHNSD